MYYQSLRLSRLKSQYYDLFVSLGEPTVFTKYPFLLGSIVYDLSPNGSLTRYAEFMVKKQWKTLEDTQLNKYDNRLRIAHTLLAVLAVSTILVVQASAP
ncbi:hypothetical protein [Agaribacterium sp. ZY112]|uniref:hypothetical protein n=1 Tax=Agaribacterium sp. ZY112 TaxID=3233574 RepID=UPI0035231EF3